MSTSPNTVPLPALDPLERVYYGEDVDATDVAEFILRDDPYKYVEVEHEIAGTDAYIASERAAGISDSDLETEITKSEKLKSVIDTIDPAVPDPVPIYEAPRPGTREHEDAEHRANLARRHLDENIKRLMVHIHPRNNPREIEYSDPDDPDAKATPYERWEATRAQHLEAIDTILKEYPDYSPRVMNLVPDNSKHVDTHFDKTRTEADGTTTTIPGKVTAAEAAADQAHREWAAIDPAMTDLTSVEAQNYERKKNAAAYAQTEAARHAKTDVGHLENLRDAIYGDGRRNSGLQNLDIHAGEDPQIAYAAEIRSAENDRRIDHETAIRAIARWSRAGDPRAEADVVGPMATMQQHLHELRDQLVNTSVRHSTYSILREAHDRLYRTMLETRFTKDSVRIDMTPRVGKDTYDRPIDAYGRPLASYTPDKGIQVHDTIIYQDGSYTSTVSRRIAGGVDIVAGVRYQADGARWIAPPAFRDLPPVTERPANVAPGTFGARLADQTARAITFRGLREGAHNRRVADGDVLHDDRTLGRLYTDMEHLNNRIFEGPFNERVQAEARLTAHIFRQRLEEFLPTLTVDAMPAPDVFNKMTPVEKADLVDRRSQQIQYIRDIRANINLLAYQSHYIEAGREGNNDRVGPDGTILTNERLNGQRARWAIRPNGAATKWAQNPANNRWVPVERYNEYGERTA